ncbi:polysaccharide deacetylase family protein [Bacillus sp. FJAT-29790]
MNINDGRHPQYTPEVLDLLAKYDAKANFFVGSRVKEYPQIFSRLVKEGH